MLSDEKCVCVCLGLWIEVYASHSWIFWQNTIPLIQHKTEQFNLFYHPFIQLPIHEVTNTYTQRKIRTESQQTELGWKLSLIIIAQPSHVAGLPPLGGHDRCVYRFYCAWAFRKCGRKCVSRLHLWFYSVLLSLLVHNGLSDRFLLTASSNQGWENSSHYEHSINGQRSEVYQTLLNREL